MNSLLTPRPSELESQALETTSLRLVEKVASDSRSSNRITTIGAIDQAVQGFCASTSEDSQDEHETNVNPSVLLVDDDDMVRRFIATALTRLGYNVYEATHGQDGIEKYTEHGDKIDVIVSDVLMPILNGPEMVRRMNEAGFGPMRVLFVTGYSDTHLPPEFSGEFPGAKRLDKPFSVDDLSRNVEDLLN